MPLSRALLSAAALCLLTPVAFAADAPPAPPPPGAVRDFMNFLTPEERLMLFAQTRQDTAGMTDEQRRAYFKARHDKFTAMPDAEKKGFAAGLKAKWDALPADQKAKVKKDMEEMRARHPRGPGGPPPGQ